MNFSFGDAVKEMEVGRKVARNGWNGKGMFLFLIAGDRWNFDTDIEGVEDVDGIKTLPFICMKTADNKLVPWVASQTDVIANDWVITK